jgi:hypothetical protein
MRKKEQLPTEAKCVFLFPSSIESFFFAEGGKCVPPVLEHGTVMTGGGDPSGGDLWVGHFACDPGYLLVGAASLKCRAGTWSSQTPKCTGRCFLYMEVKTLC